MAVGAARPLLPAGLARVSPVTRPRVPEPDDPAAPALSVVVPLYDEAPNLRQLHAEIDQALAGQSFEIVFVDDGSADDSREVLRALYQEDPRVQVVGFRRNFGKTAALAAGFQAARGAIIATLDADLQDDPHEIPGMVARLHDGADLVTAWRSTRHDPWSKRFPSWCFNGMVGALTGVGIHDLNCGLKVYRREVLRDLKLYGELHRFIPVLAAWKGYRIAEVPVQHRSRRFGRSKYGFRRFIAGFLDLLKVLFLTHYLYRPLRLFGTLGFCLLFVGLVLGLYLTGIHLTGAAIGRRPLLTLCVLLVVAGIQLICTGLIGEMLRHVSFQPEDEYSVDELLSRA
jgi:glycosyltransferase involved in cell wall biosynthesis